MTKTDHSQAAELVSYYDAVDEQRAAMKCFCGHSHADHAPIDLYCRECGCPYFRLNEGREFKLTFDPEPHEYRLHGVKIPNTTGIIEEIGSAIGLSPIYPPGPYRVRGRNVHQACVLYDTGLLDQYDVGEVIDGYVTAYKKIMADFDFEWELIEKPVYDPILVVAGTVDRFGYWRSKKKFVVADIKTNNTRPSKSTAGVQTSAYTLALKRLGYLGDVKVENVARFRLGLAQDGTPYTEECKREHDFKTWEAMCCLHAEKRMK